MPNDKKRDYIWELGNGNTHQHSVLNFNQQGMIQTSSYTPIYTWMTNSSICDTAGHILFYTNGMRISDATNHIMPNGDSLSFGDLFIQNTYGLCGYAIPQGALTLPEPNSDQLYYIFHEKANYYPAPYNWIVPGVQFSLVDMNLNNGKGDVVIKNQTAIRDTVNWGMLTATRHANGRDWWILVPGFFTPVYHRILLTPKGIQSWKQIDIGRSVLHCEDGQAVFTPDGSKYIRCGTADLNIPLKLEVFSFDRCTGLLSDYLDLTGVINDIGEYPSLAISQNSRFLYVSNCYTVYQFDLESHDIAASKQIVAIYDNFVWLNTTTGLWIMQLAANGKIYIGANGTPYLHVINNPDNLGIACDVQQHTVSLFYQNCMGLPNFPNFRLGPLAGSPCDSLFNGIGENIIETTISLNAYPNPASSQITFNLSNFQYHGNYKIMIFNSLGQMIGEIPLSSYQSTATFNTDFLANGLYQAVLWKGEEKVSCVKFVVQQ